MKLSDSLVTKQSWLMDDPRTITVSLTSLNVVKKKYITVQK
jgi:hypothetical protein